MLPVCARIRILTGEGGVTAEVRWGSLLFFGLVCLVSRFLCVFMEVWLLVIDDYRVCWECRW